MDITLYPYCEGVLFLSTQLDMHGFSENDSDEFLEHGILKSDNIYSMQNC